MYVCMYVYTLIYSDCSCSEESGLSTPVIFEIFSVFYFYFILISKSNFLFLFPEIGDFHGNP